ncbi:MAG: AAA family ATPase [Candidatus Micrarchaeota archaeon]|nr:AAA family ATPase [Candidatus Micrarchaeota archaeon]
MQNFDTILTLPSVFLDRNVLSPHFVPDVLPYREKEIEKIMLAVAPALEDQRPKNLFIYGKTGTGKTCTVKRVMAEFRKKTIFPQDVYVNCRMYNSRYRVMQKIGKTFISELDKVGFGISHFYEKLLEYIQVPYENGNQKRIIVVLDEIDMVKDLDELVYTLTRMNDEISSGSISMIGITNKISFKEVLDPRSKSSLCESEIVFSPYNSIQLREILAQRVKLGFVEGTVHDSAINLAAAIAAQETGDARYALKLLLKAGEIADEKKSFLITDREVEEARKNVDNTLVGEIIKTLPKHQQLVLIAICNLYNNIGHYQRLGQEENLEENRLLSGEVYEEYCKICRKFKRIPRSARWYREYLNELEMLGLITTVESSKGLRGHSRFIKPGYEPQQMLQILLESQQKSESETKVIYDSDL